MKHLYVDYSYMCYRSLHAIKKDIKTMGYGILRHIILKNIFYFTKKYQPDAVYICCDTGKSWRKKIYEAYKGQRKDARDKQDIDFDKFYDMMNGVKDEIREYLPFIVVDVDTLEADDIIGIMVTRHPEIEKVMVTADADYHQLLQYPNVVMYDPFRSKEISLSRAEAMLALEKKILIGDKSDNIPAVRPRLGVKTAEKMIASGEVEELIESDESFREKYELNKKLIDLTKTPKQLIRRLDEHLDAYSLSNGALLIEYFKNNKLKTFLHDITDIRKFLNRLVKKEEREVIVEESDNKFENWLNHKGL